MRREHKGKEIHSLSYGTNNMNFGPVQLWDSESAWFIRSQHDVYLEYEQGRIQENEKKKISNRGNQFSRAMIYLSSKIQIIS